MFDKPDYSDIARDTEVTIEITAEDREAINLYYDNQDEDLDGVYNILGMYLGLEPII